MSEGLYFLPLQCLKKQAPPKLFHVSRHILKRWHRNLVLALDRMLAILGLHYLLDIHYSD